MKINTISAYVLVYLLARGHWNLMVPVRADVEGDSSSGSTSGDAGSSSTGGSLSVPAGGSSSPTRARSKAGSSAGSTAGSTADSDVANLESLDSSGADGSSAAPEGSTASPDAGQAKAGESDASLTVSTGYDGSVASSTDGAGTDPHTVSGESAETGSSGDASTDSVAGQAKPDPSVELGALFPDAGLAPVEYTEGLYAKEMLSAKKADATRLADEARKTAEKLKKAAEDMIKQADELTEAAKSANNVEDLAAKMDATAYNVGVARAEAAEDSKPLDMTYYSSFPDGHHYRATDEALIKLYKLDRRANNEMYSDSFPDGWHAAGYGLSDIIISEAKKYRDEKYEKDREAKKQQILAKEGEIEAKDNEIANKDDELKLKKEAVDVKYRELEVKRREITELREVINELNRQLRVLENEASVLNSDHSKLYAGYKLLELGHKKLEEDREKLILENKNLEDEDREIVRDYYQLSGSTKHFDRKYEEREISFDPRENFPSFTEELGLLEAGEGAVKPKYLGDINPADNFSEHSLYTGASLSGGSAAPGAEAEVGETADATLTLASEAQPAEGVAQVAEPAPAADDHVASTPVAVPATHVAGEGATALAEGTSSGEAKAEGAQSTPAALRLFKTDDNGNDVEMVETTDYEKTHVSTGDDKYEFKVGVKCTKVMFGVHVIWKKGDHNVDEPKQVGFNQSVYALVVRDNDWNVVYKKETASDNWKHIKNVVRQRGTGHGRHAAHSGPSASAPGSLTTPLTGSTMNIAPDSPGSGEAEDTSSISSEAAPVSNEADSSSGSGLRGA